MSDSHNKPHLTNMEMQPLKLVTLLPKLAFIKEWDLKIKITNLIRALSFPNGLKINIVEKL